MLHKLLVNGYSYNFKKHFKRWSVNPYRASIVDGELRVSCQSGIVKFKPGHYDVEVLK